MSNNIPVTSRTLSKKILVTGGTGMVGKALQEIMPDAIYVGSKDGDLTIHEAVEHLLRIHKPDVVVHLAAMVGGILDNIQNPAEYFDDNVLMNTNLLKYSRIYGVKQFIGMLSTCIYPDQPRSDKYPWPEDMIHDGPPTPTNFSYGYAKRAMAVQIDAYRKQYGLNYTYLIPCNIYGQHDSFDGIKSHFVGALIKKIYDAKKTGADHITLYGTGDPLRQFVHVGDVAKVIKYYIDNEVCESANIAVKEYCIRTIAGIAIQECGVDLKVFFDETMPDGQYRKSCSGEKLRSIMPEMEFVQLEDGIRKTFEWYSENVK